MLLTLGDPDDPDWWPTALGFALWAIGPALLPWLAARHWWTRHGVVAAMLVFLVASSAAAAYAYAGMLRSTSSTAALALVTVPLCQYAVWLIVLLIALAVGRRERR